MKYISIIYIITLISCDERLVLDSEIEFYNGIFIHNGAPYTGSSRSYYKTGEMSCTRIYYKGKMQSASSYGYQNDLISSVEYQYLHRLNGTALSNMVVLAHEKEGDHTRKYLKLYIECDRRSEFANIIAENADLTRDIFRIIYLDIVTGVDCE
jgi:hypothetical protein